MLSCQEPFLLCKDLGLPLLGLAQYQEFTYLGECSHGLTSGLLRTPVGERVPSCSCSGQCLTGGLSSAPPAHAPVPWEARQLCPPWRGL